MIITENRYIDKEKSWLAFNFRVLQEAADERVPLLDRMRFLGISAGSSMQMGLAFSGLVVVGAMAMLMYELFNTIEKNTTAWAHRGSQD